MQKKEFVTYSQISLKGPSKKGAVH